MVIELTQGQVAVVDDCDSDVASDKWCATQDRRRRRWNAAVRRCRETRRTVFMHRVILERKLGRPIRKGFHCDHVDGDVFNNRRENLREASPAENLRNRSATRASSSKFCGVSWHKASGRWRATIVSEGRQRSLGYFEDELAAARAYDSAAIEHHGEFARLNFERTS